VVSEKGELLFPADYREWIYLSSGLGMTYGPAASTTPANPLFDNVFVNRTAWDEFKKTGKWPEAVAPFHVAILNLKQGDSATDAASEKLYRDLIAKGIDVLYHDLDERPGSKFATADLIGVPWQVVVGPKGLASGTFEIKRRADGSRETLSPAAALDLLSR
jgi:prolyl-tRNA synthetase